MNTVVNRRELETPPLLSVNETAERLGVSSMKVRRLIAAGLLPAYQLGGKHAAIRLDWNEVEQWLRADPEAAA